MLAYNLEGFSTQSKMVTSFSTIFWDFFSDVDVGVLQSEVKLFYARPIAIVVRSTSISDSKD